MTTMAKKKRTTEDKKGPFPSRKKVGYLAVPLEMLEIFHAEAKAEDRSASALARKVIREFLEGRGKWPPSPTG